LDDENDGLGYYPDGVKRTLTDEQIQIFRHSEIHSLLRERRASQRPSVLEGVGKRPPTVRDPMPVKRPQEQPSLHDSAISDETLLASGRGKPPAWRSSNLKLIDAKLPVQRRGYVGKKTEDIEKDSSSLEYDEGYTADADAKRTVQSQLISPTLVGRRVISYED
jgi:Protein of unknown function (DUF3807)